MDEIRALLGALHNERLRLEEVRHGHRVTSASAFARFHRAETAIRALLRRAKRA